MRDVEKRVSKYLQENISFVFIEVSDSDERLRLEEGIIATLNNDPEFSPSTNWLGQFSPKREISSSGLCLVQGLNGQPLTESELYRVLSLTKLEDKTNASPIFKQKGAAAPSPNTQQFQNKLNELFAEAKAKGNTYVDI